MVTDKQRGSGRVGILLLLLASTGAQAQETVPVPDEPACSCWLEAELVTTLRDDDGRAGLSNPLVVERTAGGQYLVVPANRQAAVLLFDSLGAFVRLVGRPGEGPQEFRGVMAIQPGLADSVLILDAGAGRMAVLDPTLTVVRTTRIPVTSAWFGTTEVGDIVVQTAIPRGAAQDRIRVFDRAMTPVRSFMSGEPVGLRVPVESLRRRLTVSMDGHVAVAHNDRYAVELWTVSGQHLETLTRSPDWFQPAPISPAGSRQPPSPRLETPRIDAEGRIWTVSHVPDPEWEDALADVTDLYGRTAVGVREGAESSLLDSVVEVLDPESATLLASLRIDAHVVFISSDGFAASYRQDDLGQPYIDIWKFTLVPE